MACSGANAALTDGQDLHLQRVVGVITSECDAGSADYILGPRRTRFRGARDLLLRLPRGGAWHTIVFRGHNSKTELLLDVARELAPPEVPPPLFVYLPVGRSVRASLRLSVRLSVCLGMEQKARFAALRLLLKAHPPGGRGKKKFLYLKSPLHARLFCVAGRLRFVFRLRRLRSCTAFTPPPGSTGADPGQDPTPKGGVYPPSPCRTPLGVTHWLAAAPVPGSCSSVDPVLCIGRLTPLSWDADRSLCWGKDESVSGMGQPRKHRPTCTRDIPQSPADVNSHPFSFIPDSPTSTRSAASSPAAPVPPARRTSAPPRTSTSRCAGPASAP